MADLVIKMLTTRTCRCCKGSGSFLISGSPFETQLCPRCLGGGCEGETGPKSIGYHPPKIARRYPSGIDRDRWDRISDRVDAYKASLKPRQCPYQQAEGLNTC